MKTDQSCDPTRPEHLIMPLPGILWLAVNLLPSLTPSAATWAIHIDHQGDITITLNLPDKKSAAT